MYVLFKTNHRWSEKMNKLTIYSGKNKDGKDENFDSLQFNSGQLVAIVGNTGSGKSRFIKDIEQLVNRDSISKRVVMLNGKTINKNERLDTHIIAHLSQSMRFMLDTSVEEFLQMHAEVRQTQCDIDDILSKANAITKEPIQKSDNLNLLSGGQTRALMIADIALICDSPIVLIDEIENAGIDKIKALELLTSSSKLVFIVTHDPHTALMAKTRIIMQNGGVKCVKQRSECEDELFLSLNTEYELYITRQNQLREGAEIL